MKRMIDPSTLGEFEHVSSATFTSGYAKFTDLPTLEGGLYLFTYANCSALIPIAKSMVEASGRAHIRVCMPVVYDADGSARTGILGVWQSHEPDEIVCALFDTQGNPVVDTLTLSIYKSKTL